MFTIDDYLLSGRPQTIPSCMCSSSVASPSDSVIYSKRLEDTSNVDGRQKLVLFLILESFFANNNVKLHYFCQYIDS